MTIDIVNFKERVHKMGSIVEEMLNSAPKGSDLAYEVSKIFSEVDALETDLDSGDFDQDGMRKG